MTTDLQTKNLAEAILKTFAFFDTFDYPLTAFEVWHLCSFKADFLEIQNCLEEDFLSSRLAQKNGFYFFKGRESIVEHRRRFAILAEKKMRRARLALRLWRFIPGLKGVAVCNNFYYHSESDVDVLVITDENSLWLTRFLVTIATHFAGLRMDRKKINDQVCLSFFVSKKGLDFSSLMLQDGDPYFVYWFAFLDPLYDDGVFAQLWEENEVIRKKLPNALSPSFSPFRSLSQKKHFVAPIFLNKIARYFQKKRINRRKINPENEAGGVVISDTVLKFHERDRRREYRNRYEENLKKYL